MAQLAKLATQTDGLKLLLVVQDRPALEGRAGLLPGGFPSCIYTHSDQPECLRKIQVDIFNSPFDAFEEEMARDGWTPEMFRKDNIGNLLAMPKSCLPCAGSSTGRNKRKKTSSSASASLSPPSPMSSAGGFSSEPPLKANAVVFNFPFIDDDEYFECARSATGGASLDDFEKARVINILNESEKEDLETRLFERGVPLKTLYAANESVFEECRKRPR